MGHICIFIIFPFSRLSTRSSAAGRDVFVLSFFWLLTVGLILKQLPETSSQLSFVPNGHSFISASPCRSVAFFLRLCRLSSSSSSSSSAPAASLAAALCLPLRPSPAVSRPPPCHLQPSSCFRATYCGLVVTMRLLFPALLSITAYWSPVSHVLSGKTPSTNVHMRKQKAKLISKGEGEPQNTQKAFAFPTRKGEGGAELRSLASNVSTMIRSHFNMDAWFGMEPGSFYVLGLVIGRSPAAALRHPLMSRLLASLLLTRQSRANHEPFQQIPRWF